MAKRDKIKEKLSQRAHLVIIKDSRLGKPAQRTELSMSSGSGTIEMCSHNTHIVMAQGLL